MIKKKISSRYYQIYYRKKENDSLVFDIDLLKKFRRIKNPVGYWLADPFVIKINDKNYIFAERFHLFNGKGEIVYTCLDKKRDKWHLAISEKYHMSFPNIFSKENDIWMVPETARDNNSIHIYKATRFPDLWEKGETLFQKKGYHPVDSISLDEIPFSKTILTYTAVNQEKRLLFLVNQNGIFSETHSVIDDSLMLRPAGSPIVSGDGFIIPFQDCSKTYGGGIVFRTVSTNNGTIELGQCLLKVGPSDIAECLNIKKTTIGTHTYNQNDDYEVIDIITNKISFLGLADKIYKRIVKK